MPAGAYPDAGDGHRDYQPSRFADRRRLGSTPGVALGHADGYPSQLAQLRETLPLITSSEADPARAMSLHSACLVAQNRRFRGCPRPAQQARSRPGSGKKR